MNLGKVRILLFFLVFFIFLKIQFDPDLGWHLRLGKIFLETGQAIYRNDLTWTFKGHIWPHSYLLYELLVTILFEKFGFIVTAFIFALLGSLSVIFTLNKKIGFVNIFIVVLGAVISSVNLGIRPHLFSFIFFLVLLVVIEKKVYEKVKNWPLLFIFFALWANLHPGFVVGFFVLTFYIIVDFLYRKGKKEKNLQKWPFLAVPITFLATLVNPFGFAAWNSMLFLNIGRGGHLTNIAEWEPIVVFFPVNLLFGLSGLIFVYFVYKKFKELEPAFVLIGVFLYAVSFLLTAFDFFWGAYFIFFFTRLYSKVDFGKIRLFTFVMIIAFLPFFYLLIHGLFLFGDTEQLLIRSKYPLDALRFLNEDERYKSMNIFNEYDWGGYLVWFAPQYKYFADGRMANWEQGGQRILADYLDIRVGKCASLDKYKVDLLLVKSDFDTKCFDTFTKIYQDGTAKILVKEAV